MPAIRGLPDDGVTENSEENLFTYHVARVKALRQHALKMAHLAAGGVAFCVVYFFAGP